MSDKTTGAGLNLGGGYANSTILITISIISVVTGLLKFPPHFESISERVFMENHPFILNF